MTPTDPEAPTPSTPTPQGARAAAGWIRALAATSLLATTATWSPAHAQTVVPSKPGPAHHAHPSKQRPPAKTPAATTYARHPQAQQQAAAWDADQGWTDGWAQQYIAQAERSDKAIRLMTPAPTGTAKNWAAYRSRFIEPRRLAAGARFWQQNADALARAEATYGVPAWLIVGIIGVETLYGQHTGQFRVLDALTTLAFDFPTEHPRAAERAAFFQSELLAFLQLARRTGADPLTWRGSYAGAMGLPQFMPSNWSRFGVDFDADGRVDLLNSPDDAIASVARYLQAYGWQTGMATHYPLDLDPATAQLDTLLAPDILPTFRPAAMADLGIALNATAQAHPGLLALVELENGDPHNGGAPRSYVAGTENFYAITRYNWSSYYAMAVIELGQAIQAQRER